MSPSDSDNSLPCLVCEPLTHSLNGNLLVFYSYTEYLLTPDVDLDHVALDDILFITPFVSGIINNLVPNMLVNYCAVALKIKGIYFATAFKMYELSNTVVDWYNVSVHTIIIYTHCIIGYIYNVLPPT